VTEAVALTEAGHPRHARHHCGGLDRSYGGKNLMPAAARTTFMTT
jgi:hypothetical protein